MFYQAQSYAGLNYRVTYIIAVTIKYQDRHTEIIEQPIVVLISLIK
jgi:hypothetical protein